LGKFQKYPSYFEKFHIYPCVLKNPINTPTQIT
jgi:hypothetical protein